MAHSQSAVIERLTEQAQRSILKKENENVQRLYQEYRRRINALIRDLQVLNADFLTKKKPTFAEWRQYKLDERSYKMIVDQMNRLKVDVNETFEKDLVDFYKMAYNQSGWVLDNAIPPLVDINYKLPPDQFLASYLGTPWEGAMFSERIGVITDAMARDIQTQLTVSMIQGQSVQKMASAIRDKVGIDEDQKLVTRPRASAQLYRAVTIARTEMIRASRMAQEKLYDENKDVIDDREWNVKFGGFKVCDECMLKNGKTPSEIVKMGLDTSEHPNGRCSWIPRVKSWEDLLGPVLSKGMKEEIDLPTKWRGMGSDEVKAYLKKYPDQTVEPSASGSGVIQTKVIPYDDWMELP